jgi:hypothetical protein
LLRILKENLPCTNATSEMGCLKGGQEIIEQIIFIGMRSNEMHIKIILKHDTAD